MAVVQQKETQPIYVWQVPVRVAHWVHVVSMLILAVSGYYIGNPYLVAGPDTTHSFVMGGMRLAHAIGATLLGLSFVGRLYWAIVGNRYSRIRSLIPTTRKRWRDFWRMLSYYLFLSNKRPEYVGHNPVAGITYFLLYVLVFLEGLTGLALYAEYFPGGFWWNMFGWIWELGARNNMIRLVHHSLMWAFLIFFLLHLYLAVLNDIIERSGINSSIVTGIKHIPAEE